MKPPITGGCLYGLIRYEDSAKPVARVYCHCRSSQKATGIPYLALMFVPCSALIKAATTRGIRVLQQVATLCTALFVLNMEPHYLIETVPLLDRDNP